MYVSLLSHIAFALDWIWISFLATVGKTERRVGDILTALRGMKGVSPWIKMFSILWSLREIETKLLIGPSIHPMK